MITLRISANIRKDRRLLLQLPPDVPTGRVELSVTVQPNGKRIKKRPGTSLAKWAEENAEHWGDQISSEDVEGFTGRRF